MPTAEEGAPTRVGRGRGDTRARILEAALQLFVERGYAGTSVRDIAERLGLTKAAVHYHFAAKEQLVLALVTPVVDALRSVLDVRAGTGAPPAEVLRDLLGVLEGGGPLLALMTSDPSVGHTASELHAQFEELGLRAAQVLAGPDAAPGRLLRAHCALAALAAGWDQAYRTAGGGPSPEALQTVLAASLGALGD